MGNWGGRGTGTDKCSQPLVVRSYLLLGSPTETQATCFPRSGFCYGNSLICSKHQCGPSAGERRLVNPENREILVIAFI